MKVLCVAALVLVCVMGVTRGDGEAEVADALQDIQGRRQTSRTEIKIPTIPNLLDPANLLNPANKPAALDPTALANQLTAALQTNPTDQILLKLGNILGALGGGLGGLGGGLGGGLNLDKLGLDKLGLGGLTAGVAAGAATDVGVAAIGGTLAALSAVTTGILGLGNAGLEVANFILAIIGIVLLGVFLAEGDGDLTELVGITTARRSDNNNGYYIYDSSDDQNSYTSYARSARSLWNSPIVQGITDLIADAVTKYEV